MKKKLLYSLLLVTILACTAGCGGKDNSKESNANNENVVTETTETPTIEPLPTAETTMTEDENGNAVCQNTSDGYTVSYDKDSFELTNESHTISIHVPNKDASSDENGTKGNASAYNEDGTSADNSYMNVFCTITTSTDISAKDYRKSLQTAYKGNYKKKEVKIGANKTKAVQYTISDGDGMRHEMYVVDGKDKVHIIELKCPKSQKKKYNSKLDAVLESLTFA